ncbi:autotransporter outer membrane beta-barrel domain-containing protein [Variovorax paradoxus]|nr:autotransporter outer membrane beta-barrel domain-containing protein [Variovorax paradoxus]
MTGWATWTSAQRLVCSLLLSPAVASRSTATARIPASHHESRKAVAADAASATHADIGGHSTLASVEFGKRFKLIENWDIEPQAQLIVGKQHLDEVVIPAAVFAQDPRTNLTARLGVRLVGDYATGAGRLKPYARLNLWHGLGDTDRMLVAGPGGSTGIDTKRGYASAEIAAGGTWTLSRQVNVYGGARVLVAGGWRPASEPASLGFGGHAGELVTLATDKPIAAGEAPVPRKMRTTMDLLELALENGNLHALSLEP